LKILYGAPASTFVRKPRILLVEKNIPFITIPVNPMLETSEEFKAISPLGKIPVFQDENFTIADSSVICAYIDKQYPTPSFYPNDPKALSQALWLEEYADTALFQAIAPCYYQTVLVPLYRNRQPDQHAIQVALSQQLPPIADYLEKTLAHKEFFVANQFSIADVTIISIFLNMHAAGFPLSKTKWPGLAAYLDRHFQRASFSLSMEDVKKECEKLTANLSCLL
jgi:glutathione S-transferase